MKIDQSSDIKELLSKLLVTKNKLSLIKAYYNNISDELVNDLDTLYNNLMDDIDWMDNQLSDMESKMTSLSTAVNNFVALTSPEDKIAGHAKYLEMLALYNKYISLFHTRMTELEDTYEKSFLKSGINEINSSWKFHYSDDRTDASNIEHSFSSINFTKDSDILEISNSRYVYRTEDNFIVDADYKSKNCYVTYIDGKTIFNKYAMQGAGSEVGYYGEESAKIIKLFKLPDRSGIYMLIDLCMIENPDNSIGDIVGKSSDGVVHVVVFAKYDFVTKEVSILLNDTNTSILYIRDKVLADYKLKFVNGIYDDYHYFYISTYFVRVKVEAARSDELEQSILLTSAVNICSAIIRDSRYLVIPVSDKKICVFDLTGSIVVESPYYSLMTTALSSQFETGEQGSVNNIVETDDKIYFLTDKSIWYTSNLFVNVEKDPRGSKIADEDLSFKDDSQYAFDTNGYFYYLSDNSYVYCIQDVDAIVMSPTRYSDRLFFIKGQSSESSSGYIYSRPGNNPLQDNAFHSFAKDGHYILISDTGNYSICYIESGTWVKKNLSLGLGNANITAVCEDTRDNIYIATSDSKLYKIVKDDLVHGFINAATLLVNASVGNIFALCYYNERLYIGGFSGRVSVYNLDKSIFYRFDDETGTECVNTGTALVNQNIRGIVNSGSDIIIFGNNGKVASCNTVSKLWTNCKGGADNGETTDSIIFNDGSAIGGRNINAAVVYIGTTLFIFGDDGVIASCNLSSGSWTNYDGTNGNAIVAGPGIYNNGEASNYMDIKSVLVVDNIAVIGTQKGYIMSLNLVTGGITTYKGIAYDSEISGPGIYYDGSSFANNDIMTIAIDAIRGLIVFAGTNSYISTYSTEERAVLSPEISKLYYVARNASDNDYLSSLLVQLSTETLKEYKALTPPREPDSVYVNAFNSTFYTYKNGDVVYTLSARFNSLYKSTDGGVTSKLVPMSNIWASGMEKYNIDEPIGYVTKSGELAFYAEVNKIPRLLFTSETNDITTAKWYTLNETFESRTFTNFGHLTNGEKDLFYLVKNVSSHTETYLLKNSDNPNMLALLDAFGECKIDCAVSMLENGRVITAAVDNKRVYIKEFTFESFDLNPVVSINVESRELFNDGGKNLIDKHFENIHRVFDTYLGFFTTGNTFFNYIYGDSATGDIDIVTIAARDLNKVFTSSGMSRSDDWDIVDTFIYAKQYIPIYGKTRYTSKPSVTLSDVTFGRSYVSTVNNGMDGLLGVDVTYTENFNAENSLVNGGTRNAHVVISLNTDMFGKYTVPNFRVFKVLNNFGHLVSVDETCKEFIVSTYTKRDDNGRIRHTNLINKFTLKDSVVNSPLRSLQGAWYTARFALTHASNALAIKCKFRTLGTESEIDAIAKQEVIRYQVMIQSLTSGKFILYEVEKSPIMSRMDRETKVANPLFRVKAIDRFDARITELYTSRLTGRQSAFYRVQPDNPNYPNNYVSKSVNTFDFIGYIDFSRVISDRMAGEIVEVKIRPMNTLPSTVDAKFSIESYAISPSYDVAAHTEAVTAGFNNIERSEYKDEFALSEVSLANIGIPGESGFLERSAPDIVHLTDKLHSTNHYDLPQIDSIPLNLERGKADTYCVRLIGNGDGTYNSTTGIIMHTGLGVWKFVPYTSNRKQLAYSFDEESSKKIADQYDLKICKAGRNLFKMKRFGVFAKSVINDADFHVAYNGVPRIAKSEGNFTSYYGAFEAVSTFDGYQKRIASIIESNEASLYRTLCTAYDKVNERKFGLSYDIVDRYSIFELPYYYVQAWWIPAKGYITRGNESLLTYDSDESENHYRKIGRYRLPFSGITAPVISVVESGSTGGGIGSAGQAYESNKVAFSTLLDEKYPLEHWDGFNDLDFVTKWKDTYVDRTDRIRYVVEKPKDTEGNTKMYTYDAVPSMETETTPTVPRNLYFFNNTQDWDGRGGITRKYCTGYYYDAHDWKIYKYERYTEIYDYDALIESDEIYTTDKNLATLVADPGQYVAGKSDIAWYVPVASLHTDTKYDTARNGEIRTTTKPTGDCIEYWPRPSNYVVGEKLIDKYVNTADAVVIARGNEQYRELATGNLVVANPKYERIQILQRGNVAFDSKTTDSKITPSGGTDDSLLGVSVKVSDDHSPVVPTAKSITKPAKGFVVAVNALNINPKGDNGGNSALLDVLNGSFTKSSVVDVPVDSVAELWSKTTGAEKSVTLFAKRSMISGTRSLKLAISGYSSNVGFVKPLHFNTNILECASASDRPYTSASDAAVTQGDLTKNNYTENRGTYDFMIQVRRYYADGTESVVYECMSKTAASNYVLDRYIGGKQHAYLYGAPMTVSFNLKKCVVAANSNVAHSRTYYKYKTVIPSGSSVGTIYNGSGAAIADSEIYGCAPFIDYREPAGAGSASEVVDTEYVSVTTPSVNANHTVNDAGLVRTYTFKQWLANGTTKNVTETHGYNWKWFYITSADIDAFTPYGTDASGANRKASSVSIKRLYEWQDGYVYAPNYTTKTSDTFGNLESDYGATTEESIAKAYNSSGVLQKTYSISVTGTNITTDTSGGDYVDKYSSASAKVAGSKTVNVLYANTKTDPGTAKTQAVKWDAPNFKKQ